MKIHQTRPHALLARSVHTVLSVVEAVLYSVHYKIFWWIILFFLHWKCLPFSVLCMTWPYWASIGRLNFSFRKETKNVLTFCMYWTYLWTGGSIVYIVGKSHSLSVFLIPRACSPAPWTRWRTLRGVSLCLSLALRPLRRTNSLSRSTSSTLGTFRVRTPISPHVMSASHMWHLYIIIIIIIIKIKIHHPSISKAPRIHTFTCTNTE